MLLESALIHYRGVVILNLKAGVSIHNKFEIEVRNKDTGELKQKGYAYNIVLNTMWSRLINFQTYFTNIHFGTGSGTLTPSRTTLFTWLGQKTAIDVELIKAIPISSWKRSIVLNPEEFVGSTLTEVGIAHSPTASTLVTHALIEDSEGNPISIIKTAVDIVTIHATIFCTFTTQDSNNIKFVSMPNSNPLVNYLIGGTTFPIVRYYAGSADGEIHNIDRVVCSESLGQSSDVAAANWVRDAVNRRATTPALRFGTTAGNGHVMEIGLGSNITAGVFKSLLPIENVFTGQPYTGVAVGSGNGIQTTFLLPSRNLRQNTINMRLNGVLTTNYLSEVVMSLLNFKFLNPVILPTGWGHGTAFSPDSNYLSVAHDTSPFVTIYKRSGDTFTKLDNPAILPTGLGYGTAFSPDSSYLSVAHGTSPFVTIYDCKKRTTQIVFNSPPANGVSVTAEYTTEGIHKTDQYVIDCAVTIQYGEVN